MRAVPESKVWKTCENLKVFGLMPACGILTKADSGAWSRDIGRLKIEMAQDIKK